MTLQLYVNLNFDITNDYTAVIDVNSPPLPLSACVVGRCVQIAEHHVCNTLKYSIYFPSSTWCELCLTGYGDGGKITEMFYIRQKPCP